ncbi:MAG: P-loop NTPase, partial [Pirellulales bacterium]|nr:P-loop NTPase [Pirellulales bacterium]
MINNVNPPHRLPGPSHATNAQPDVQFDPWLVWVTFRRCWPWAIPVGAVLAALATFAVLQSFVPRYRASSLLVANDDYILERGVFPTVTDLAKSEKLFFSNPIVLDQVLDNPLLRKAPSLSNPETAEGNLRRNLSISTGGSKKQMVVAYEDTDREAAAEICNAVVTAYLACREEFDSARVNDLERWLMPEIDNWEHMVEERKRRVHDLSRNTLGYAPGQRAAVIEDQNHLAHVSDLRGQITDYEVQLSLLDAQQKMEVENQQSEPEFTPATFIAPEIVVEKLTPTESQITAAIEQNATVVEALAMVKRYKQSILQLEDNGLTKIRREQYQDQISKRDQWLDKLAQARTDARAEVVASLDALAEEDYKRRQSDAAAKIKALKQEFETNQKIAQQEKLRENANRIVERQRERDTLVEKLGVLRTKYATERERLEKFGIDSADLQFAYDDLAVANDVLERLRARVAVIRTERQKAGAVRTLAPALPPKSPVETVPMKKLLAASGGAFLLPFLLGLLWEFKIQRVTDSTAMEKSRSLAPVVGEVARLPAGSGVGKGRRLFEESIDTLRANLFLSGDAKNTRTIAVASSMSGEGKSSVASQLAISIAKATGKTVLLVDADLRCPDQHSIFGLDMGPGLSGVLSGEASLQEAID